MLPVLYIQDENSHFLLDHCEFTDFCAETRCIHMINIDTKCDIQFVFGQHIPHQGTVIECTLVLQCLHQLALNIKYPDGTFHGQMDEMEFSGAAAGRIEVQRFPGIPDYIWIRDNLDFIKIAMFYLVILIKIVKQSFSAFL